LLKFQVLKKEEVYEIMNELKKDKTIISPKRYYWTFNDK